jgi:anti-sigma regulatory factor (Ser/Thr protein kinase)
MPEHRDQTRDQASDQARELMRRFPGWSAWRGSATGSWWAMGPGRLLVECADPMALAARIAALVPPAAQSPAPAPVTVRLDTEQHLVRTARRQVRQTLTAWGLDHLTDDAVLTVSELATNAQRHAHPPITLTLSRDGVRLAIELSDGSTDLPTQRDPGDCGGFGHTVVQSLADVTITVHPTGKTIRALLPRTAPAES